jgi:choline kinase
MTQTAVILVAGMGSRLRPLTDSRPKALVEVAGQSILLRALNLLRAHGVDRVVLATGYLEARVRAAVSDTGMRAEFFYNPEFDTTQNAVSLALCRSALVGQSFFKLDGDVIFARGVLERLDASSAPLAVAVDGTRRLDSEAMKVRVASGRISAFGKQLRLDESAGESIGIERVDAAASAPLFEELSRAMNERRTDLYYEDIYSELIQTGQIVAEPVEVGDLPWAEIDDHQDLQRASAVIAASHE